MSQNFVVVTSRHLLSPTQPVILKVKYLSSQICCNVVLCNSRNIHTFLMEGILSEAPPPPPPMEIPITCKLHTFLIFLPYRPPPQEILIPPLGVVWIFSRTAHFQLSFCDQLFQNFLDLSWHIVLVILWLTVF